MSETFKNADEAVRYVQSVPKPQGATMHGVPFEKRDVIRFGLIGLGGRGYSLLGEVLANQGSQVTAVCDIAESQRLRAKERVEKAGQPAPALESEWRKLCERNDVDIVYICSPWDLHTPQAVYAMECGKHAAVEVPAATTLEECWKLVDTSERTRKHCVLLENCCYCQNELMVLNIVRAGLFGSLTHGEAAYIHDLRSLLLSDQGEGLWRREPHKLRNGNLYPTHGLGPVAWWMNVNHGDRFTRIVSMSSPSASLGEYRDAHIPAGDPKHKETYPCGDMNSSLIQTATGRSILLQHDVVTPRPYSLLCLIAGTKGTFADYPARIFVDSAGKHEWQAVEDFREQYEHSLWRKQGELARSAGGHGGIDFIMNYRLIQTYRQGLPPDINVYDAAAWSAPGPLSDISVAHQNLALPFPDFTRGQWKDAQKAAEWNKNICDNPSVLSKPVNAEATK
jgi:predicted dehydrogenase